MNLLIHSKFIVYVMKSSVQGAKDTTVSSTKAGEGSTGKSTGRNTTVGCQTQADI